ncbi:MAG: His-Xaa-Ser system protein HxsD [Planctomycetes bacterium]|nr:His-Xaa-Ser system protein HxsD [Planctomycetota bacterium]
MRQMESEIREQRFEFSLSMFTAETIQKAAYRFTGNYAVSFRTLSQDVIEVTFRPLTMKVDHGKCSDFPNEVLDQHLRGIVAKETADVRNIILAQAFTALAILDPVGESADYQDDPLGIAGLAGPKK